MATHAPRRTILRAFGVRAVALSIAFSMIALPVAADTVQDGDNEAGGDQGGSLSSGDAVAGGQVISNVGTGDATIRATNRSQGARARSGDVEGSNRADLSVGPRSQPAAAEEPSLGEQLTPASPMGPTGAGDLTAAGGLFWSDDGSGPTGPQGPTGPAGPLVLVVSTSPSGAPTGATWGTWPHPSMSVQAPTGPTLADVRTAALTGPLRAAVVQAGDNKLDVDQSIRLRGGDAIAGSQVIALAQQGRVFVDASNSSVDAYARSGDLSFDDVFTDVHIGSAAVGPQSGPVGGVGPEGPLGAELAGSSLVPATGSSAPAGSPATVTSGSTIDAMAVDGADTIEGWQGPATGDALSGGEGHLAGPGAPAAGPLGPTGDQTLPPDAVGGGSLGPMSPTGFKGADLNPGACDVERGLCPVEASGPIAPPATGGDWR